MASPNSTLIVAEKPSVARDIAKVVGCTQQNQGYLSGNGYVVTWAIGHLLTLSEPSEMNPDWKAWRKQTLPMIPERWSLKVIESTKTQFHLISKLFQSADQIICATDAGREGELIFRYIAEAAGFRTPFKRLWISSLTADSIRKGLSQLQDARKFDGLADAARARSRADWLVGMNYSRAYALSTGEPFFVGRVQTPTLALVVQRDLEILNFKPESYLELKAVFARFNSPSSDDLLETPLDSYPLNSYQGVYCGNYAEATKAAKPQAKRLPVDAKLADAILTRIQLGDGRVLSVQSKEVSDPPPLLYDLTDLQRHSNRLFGFSAARTLEVAQALYERHKLISYPRTDSRYLSKSVAETLPGVVNVIRTPFEELLCEGTGRSPLGSRFVNDAQVSDHHAIIPTEISIGSKKLSEDEDRIYGLICRRLLSAWQEDHLTSLTTVLTEVQAEVQTEEDSEINSARDCFLTQGVTLIEKGWKRLELRSRDEGLCPELPSWIEVGREVQVVEARKDSKTTTPPPHLTEGALLSGMENAGRKLEDRELARVMRECGLGTSATRASIIETLLSRNYVERNGKFLKATDIGVRLIQTVDESVKSPELTARWEQGLSQIHEGGKTLREFMDALEAEVKSRTSDILAKDFGIRRQEYTPSPEGSLAISTAPSDRSAPAPSGLRPVSTDLRALLKTRFGFSEFRPHQEAVCRAVVEGKNVLLVMPTGAGKSLCYQLPGLALGGCTLVISPLLALIEDQVEKLNRMGLVADRIHSGRTREDSRRACVEYLGGRLNFLFVAPERLAVPGFMEMLARRTPSLIAIDEAHCISHWGHDFRPNYRLLGARLNEFRPAPVIALTATATPLVQEDIVKQLGFRGETRFIQGFRRNNIAIQNFPADPSQRLDGILSALKEKGRIPAIVYAPTRKAAEKLCLDLKSHYQVEVYHAGLSPQSRDRTQKLFLDGKLDLMVATVAFGMGIDKADIRTVIHAGLPGSIESYYQEIGRAGRDGKPSLAVLLHSYADQLTHEFFFERDYPEPKVLKAIYEVLGEQKKPKDWVFGEVRDRIKTVDSDLFDKALEKLWIHQGARVDPDESISRGVPEWEQAYSEQARHRRKQLDQMVAFTRLNHCRMKNLVRHFGDQNDSGEDCGICDFCAPGQVGIPHQAVPVSNTEQKMIAGLMASLAGQDHQALGRLYQELAGGYPELARKDFERILVCLSQAGWIEVKAGSFQKDGETISYRKASLRDLGRSATHEALKKLRMIESSLKSVKAKRGRKSRTAERLTRPQPALSQDSAPVFEALRSWRLTEAKKQGIPAFRIMSDRILKLISEDPPANSAAFLNVKGIGPKTVGKYGQKILEIVNQSRN